jgi:hypothetical protein
MSEITAGRVPVLPDTCVPRSDRGYRLAGLPVPHGILVGSRSVGEEPIVDGARDPNEDVDGSVVEHGGRVQRVGEVGRRDGGDDRVVGGRSRRAPGRKNGLQGPDFGVVTGCAADRLGCRQARISDLEWSRVTPAASHEVVVSARVSLSSSNVPETGGRHEWQRVSEDDSRIREGPCLVSPLPIADDLQRPLEFNLDAN